MLWPKVLQITKLCTFITQTTVDYTTKKFFSFNKELSVHCLVYPMHFKLKYFLLPDW